MEPFSAKDIAWTYLVANIAEREGRKRERMKILQSQVVAEIPPKQPTQQNRAREVGRKFGEAIVQGLARQLDEARRRAELASWEDEQKKWQYPKPGYEYSAAATVQPFVLQPKSTPPQPMPISKRQMFVVLGVLLTLVGLTFALTGAWRFWWNLV